MLAEGRRERLVCSQWRALCRTALWRARDFSAGSRAPVGVWCDPYVPLIALKGHPKRRQLVRRLFSLANFSCQILLTGELNSLPSRVMILHAFWAWCFHLKYLNADIFIATFKSLQQSMYCIWLWTWIQTLQWERRVHLSFTDLLEHQTRTLWMEGWRSVPGPDLFLYSLWSRPVNDFMDESRP